MKNFQPVKGVKDILADEYLIFQNIVDSSKAVGALYGYKEISLPIFEYTEVFSRTLGDASDIVHKEMYTFNDRKDRSITLRPEFTASVMRCVLSNSLYNTTQPLKLVTTGPLFRYERPQKLRYRQFHQVNFENIGESGPLVDAEIILLANNIIERLGVKEVELNINNLGDENSRKQYSAALVAYLEKYKDSLSSDSQVRLYKNPLRILDSKDEGDKKIMQDAPLIQDCLSEESTKSFAALLENLESLGIKYKINKNLVRGLDYYTGAVFEFISNALGAQGTVIAGGRYDGLMKKMGGPDLPSIGFGMGVERIMSLAENNFKVKRGAVIILLNPKYESHALKLAKEIRQANIMTTINRSYNIAKAMKSASESNAKIVIFLGDEEVSAGKVKIKDMDLRSEDFIVNEQLTSKLSSYEF